MMIEPHIDNDNNDIHDLHIPENWRVLAMNHFKNNELRMRGKAFQVYRAESEHFYNQYYGH